MTTRITPFLWFDGKAEEAMNFYVSIFKNSKVLNVSAGPDGKAISVTFQLEGQEFHALNGGPQYKFNPAISLFVNCETQQEVDYFWEKLSEGGQKVECGWLKDKFGLAWQIVPNFLLELLTSGDQTKTDRVMRAVMSMKKLEIDDLKKAAEGN